MAPKKALKNPQKQRRNIENPKVAAELIPNPRKSIVNWVLSQTLRRRSSRRRSTGTRE